MVPETGRVVPSPMEIEAMARRRHQNPKPFIHGNWWVINYRLDAFEEGKLKLDDPVSKYLTGFDNLRVITKFNEPLEIWKVPIPELEPGGVLVKLAVHGCG